MSLRIASRARRSMIAPGLRSSSSIFSMRPYPFLRTFNTSPGKRSAAFNSTAQAPSNMATTHATAEASSKNVKPSLSEYLTAFSTSELFLYLIIGCATMHKSILDMCIKVFPWVPIPVIRALVYKIYCGGENIEEVKQTGQRLRQRGINNMMISLTIEACDGNDNIDPEYIVSETCRSVNEILIPHTVNVIETSSKDINSIPPGYVALKPTGFAHDAANVLRHYNTPEYAPAFESLVEKAAKVCELCHAANVKLAKEYPERTAPFVVAVVDAEKYELQEGVYELQRRLYQKFNKLDEPVSVVGTLQMYLSGSADLLSKEQQLAEEGSYRLGLKLVRGAYIHSEKNRAVIHKDKNATDVNYNEGISYCIDLILKTSGNESVIGHLVVASHNADSLQLATRKIQDDGSVASNKNKNNIVLGQLLGMADKITHNLISQYNVDNIIKYVAWGPPVETKEYLLRRLEENGDAVKSDNGLPLVFASLNVMAKRLLGRA